MNKIISESESIRLQPASTRGKVCIVTAELAGPFHNGGVGTANRAMALILRNLGYEVDILYTRVQDGKPFSARGTFDQHVEALHRVGIELKCIDHRTGLNDWCAMSHLALQHLLRNRYNFVFFDDLFGTAFYPLLARHTGSLALRDTIMCVTAHSPLQWLADLDQYQVTKIEDLRWGEMERRSVELADALRAPSGYMLRKYHGYGWSTPANSIVLPNFVSSEHPIAQPIKRIAVQEIVFFGRLETRKGLWVFCRALDRLKFRLSGCRVTFVGKDSDSYGISNADTLVRRSAAWPFPIRLLTNFDRDQALSYLQARGRLAIMPSPEDNSPSTILECLERGIPFIASSGSGGEELLDEESRKTNLFEPTVDHLCSKLADVMERGAVTGRPSFDQQQLEAKFTDWLDGLRTLPRAQSGKTAELAVSGTPVLIVVVPRDFNAERAVAELRWLVRAYEEKIRIEVIAEEPVALRSEIASGGLGDGVHVSGAGDYGQVAQKVAAGGPAVVGLCHISQVLPPEWVERARVCFAAESGIAAVTGMVATKREPDRNPRDPYVSVADHEHEIERYLMGNTPPLFAVAQETNSGFVLMRSEMLEKCSSVGPRDEPYDRLKRMQDWVHEVLVTLHASGERFELVPDMTIGQPVKETPFEIFRLEAFMRSLPAKLYGFAPGSDQAVLARLAIDNGLEQERALAHARYVTEIGVRTGAEIKQLPLYTPWEEQALQLAAIAHAGGQVDLAVEISAGLAIQDEPTRPLNLVDYVRAAAAGEVVNLVEALAHDHRMIGLPSEALPERRLRASEFLPNGTSRPDRRKSSAPTLRRDGYSIWGPWDKRKVEIRVGPASAGLIGISLPLLNLSKITHFSSTIAVQDEAADPVRFRIELIARDRQHRWSAERIVEGGSELVWDLECPKELRDECEVRFGVDLADGRSTPDGTIARWTNPRFLRRT